MALRSSIVIALAFSAPSTCWSAASSTLGAVAPTVYQIRLEPTPQLQRFTLPDAAQAQDIGPIADAYFACAHDPVTNQLLAVDQQQLGVLSPVDASFTPLFTLQGTQGTVTGLATLGAPEPLYLSTYDGAGSPLYRINRSTGLATLVGVISGRLVVDIAINGSGELYAHDTSTDSIYRVDPATAATQLVGPTGISSNYAQGMDFDRSTGLLYAWIYDDTQGDTAFSQIDLNTGNAHVLVRLNGEFEGMITALPPRIFIDGFEP